MGDRAEVAALGGGDDAIGKRGDGKLVEVVAVDTTNPRGRDGPFLREIHKGLALGFGDAAVFEDAGEEGRVMEEGGVVWIGDGIRDNAGKKPLEVGRCFVGALAGGYTGDGRGTGAGDGGPSDGW